MRYILILLLSVAQLICQAQRLTVGIASGTGFSDFHGNFNTGKLETRAGTLSAIFLKYSLTPVLGIETGLDYTTQNYEYKNYQYNPNNNTPGPFFLKNYYDYYTVSEAPRERWEFGFLRVPLYLSVSTPTKLRLSFSAGFYLSRTVHHEYSAQGIYYPPYLDWYPYYDDPKTPKYDNGMTYAASLAYPISDHWRIQFSGRYFIGHKSFIEPYAGRTGTTELNLGIGYTGLFKARKTSPGYSGEDTTLVRFHVIPLTGISFSHIDHSEYTGGFRPRESITAGLWLEYRINPALSVISGLTFQRRGYRMDDSSTLFYRHGPSSGVKYNVQTRIDLNYAVIPILFKIQSGPPVDFYILSGPYIGMLLNARSIGTASFESSYSGGYTLNKVNVFDDIGGNIRANDFGWIFGAGFEFPLPGGLTLNAGLHYDLGISNILSDAISNQYAHSNEDQVMHNRSYNILVGITIPIRKIKEI